MSNITPEKQPSQSIPVVDRKTIDEIVRNRKSGLPDLIETFDIRHPEIGNVIFSNFRSQGETIASRVTYGALIAGILLEHAQKRVGGIVLEKTSESVVETSLLYMSRSSDHEVEQFRHKMNSSQKELFRGLQMFADIAGTPPNHYEVGGMLMLLIYDYILERGKLL